LPPVSRPALLLLGVGLLVLAWATGRLRVDLEDGGLQVVARLSPKGKALRLDLRDTGLSLLLVMSLNWAVATALDRSWLNGSDRLVPAAMVASLLGLLLVSSGISARLLSAIATLVSAGYAVLTTLGAVHLAPTFHLEPAPAQVAATWGAALIFQSQFGLLVGLVGLMLFSGFWAAWWVFRRRSGLVALLPSATVLAVEILNDPTPSLYFFSLTWLASGVLLLIRLNYLTLKRRWRARRLPRASDTTWTFGEIGFQATAILLVAAFLLPPLNTHDISNYLIPGSVNTGKLFHPFGLGNTGPRNPADIGYSETVRPGFQLKAKPVTIMTVGGEVGLYPYWRGVALGAWNGLEWTLLLGTQQAPVYELARLEPHDRLVRDDLGDDLRLFPHVRQSVHVVGKPEQTLWAAFSGGEILSVDRHPVSIQGEAPAISPFFQPGRGGQPPRLPSGQRAVFHSVDRARLADNPRPPYDYTVEAVVAAADEGSLRAAGQNYPAWVRPYATVYQGTVFPNANADRQIEALARRIVSEAKAGNPYDQAKALEQYLRDKSVFTYTLTPDQAPEGTRPLEYFLFTSHKGYCQDFSTAMAVMLRYLGIPVRQMSGFGLGSFDIRTQRYVVKATDAHTWAEVYFPGFGWIPFEPTPDGVNRPVERPATLADNPDASAPPSAGVGRGENDNPRGEQLPPDEEGGFGGPALTAVWSRAWPVALAVVLAFILAALLGLRWLVWVKDAPRIWRRLRFLGDRLRVPRRPGDTPNEYGARLAHAVPEVREEVAALARLYTRFRFRHGGLDPDDTQRVRGAWRRVRQRYPALLARAWRAGLRPEAGRGSGSRAPGSRR